MRVLVDSTIWIDFFAARKTNQTDKLKQSVRDGHQICVCGCIWLEVLQGVRQEKEYLAIKQQFENLIYLDDDRSTFELGATIYRELRRAGVTIRNSIDCLIAATVVQHSVNFLENDRDYKFIDQHFPLNRI
ncbi:MAG TPA: PIN domain-containing protein [Verrucomicrobiae bacterium]